MDRALSLRRLREDRSRGRRARESRRPHRRKLTAFISKDDGKTWSSGLVIDERISCSYPEAQQSPDGTIYLTWDFNRSKDQEILMTTFYKEDVLSVSEATARVKTNRRLVSKGGMQ